MDDIGPASATPVLGVTLLAVWVDSSRPAQLPYPGCVSRISRSNCQASAETLSGITRRHTSEVGRAGVEPATNGLPIRVSRRFPLCFTRDRTRTFVCVRMTPTTEELADAADLRAQAKQVHSRHTLEAVNWVKKRGQAPLGEAPGEVVGYHRAALDWFDEEQDRSDGKWLKWFGNL
jgi:hypothetical protein